MAKFFVHMAKGKPTHISGFLNGQDGLPIGIVIDVTENRQFAAAATMVATRVEKTRELMRLKASELDELTGGEAWEL